jgi:hypothetical protein
LKSLKKPSSSIRKTINSKTKTELHVNTSKSKEKLIEKMKMSPLRSKITRPEEESASPKVINFEFDTLDVNDKHPIADSPTNKDLNSPTSTVNHFQKVGPRLLSEDSEKKNKCKKFMKTSRKVKKKAVKKISEDEVHLKSARTVNSEVSKNKESTIEYKSEKRPVRKAKIVKKNPSEKVYFITILEA